MTPKFVTKIKNFGGLIKMNLIKSDKIKELCLGLNKSKVLKMRELINSDPYLVFDNREICQTYNFKHGDKLEVSKSRTILSRLSKNRMLLSTKTQLRNGYFYSLNNKVELEKLCNNHLLPYDFEDKDYVLDLIIKSNFEKLNINERINEYFPKSSGFIDKYGRSYLLSEEVKTFIAMNIGFLMCDGHIKKNLDQIHYFFNQESDAKLFKSDFLLVFNKEKLSLNYTCNCFTIGICSKDLAILFNELGVPRGNKVYQQFLIPNWIFNGSDNIKRIFLSTIYGNEGSKPQDNKWRIQFVLSKSKEHVPNLLQFLNQIRSMLNYFGIQTSHIQLRKQKRRAFSGRFYIKGKENIKIFYNRIGFLYASEKQEVLKSLIVNENS